MLEPGQSIGVFGSQRVTKRCRNPTLKMLEYKRKKTDTSLLPVSKVVVSNVLQQQQWNYLLAEALQLDWNTDTTSEKKKYFNRSGK